jgi:heme/copper-type cytochrome/quinol oxidase subunit 4
MNLDHHDVSSTPSFWRSPAGMCLLVALAVLGFYLATEHTAHVMGALPYVLFLACPLMHVFMHHGHGQHGGSASSQQKGTDDEQRHQ